jgi:hypothetical protein
MVARVNRQILLKSRPEGAPTRPHQVAVWRVSNGSGAPFSGYRRYSRCTTAEAPRRLPMFFASGFCAAGPSSASKAQYSGSPRPDRARRQRPRPCSSRSYRSATGDASSILRRKVRAVVKAAPLTAHLTPGIYRRVRIRLSRRRLTACTWVDPADVVLTRSRFVGTQLKIAAALQVL